MVIAFIFVASALAYLLLILAFVIEDYIIGLISGIAILYVGIYMAVYNIEGISHILVQAFALISICLGAYVFINGSIEKIEELM